MPVLRRLLPLGSAALLTASLVLAAPAEAATPVKVAQLNLCHSGAAGCYDPETSSIEWGAGVVRAERPVAVTVNEVCADDLPDLAERTGADDHRFVAAQLDGSAPLDNPVLCLNGEPYGVGILSLAGEFDWEERGIYADQDDDAQDGGENRVWMCAGGSSFGVCVTHLTHKDGAVAMKQCRSLLDGPMAEHAAEQPMVLGGDFNLRYGGDPNVQDCISDGYVRKGDGGVQHVVTSSQLGFDRASTVDHDGSTDHPALIAHLTAPW